MADDIGEMIAPGVQTSQPVVEPEGEYTQGPITLVRACVCQRSSPEVVVGHMPYRGAGQEVRILYNGPAVEGKIKRDKKR